MKRILMIGTGGTIASEMGGDGELASQLSVFTTVFSIFSIILLVYLSRALLLF